MNENKKFRNKIRNDDHADLGVATLIIFMAMVLIAALAASMIIYTGGSLQKKSINRSDLVTQDSCQEQRLSDFMVGSRTVDANNTNSTYNNSNNSYLNRNDSTCVYTRHDFAQT